MKGTVTQQGLTLELKHASGLEARIIHAAALGLKRGLQFAISIAQREYLSGPRPVKLDVRTGQLRNRMSAQVTETPGRGVIGRFGNNVKYAAFHEFGFHGIMNVKGHSRVTKQVNSIGREIDLRRPSFQEKDGTVIGQRDSRKRAAARQRDGLVGVQFVKAHTRKVNYAGRPFAKPALAKAQPLILRAIKEELKKL